MLDVASLGRRLRSASAEQAAEEIAEVSEIALRLLLECTEVRAAGGEVEADAAGIVEAAAAWNAAGSPARTERRAAAALQLFELLGVLPAVAPPVVGGASGAVAEHVVGGVDLLEALLSGGVAAGHVGVVAAREATEGRLNLLVGGGAGNFEDVVEVGCHLCFQT